MRILQVVGGLAEAWGGPSKVVRELSEALARRGHDVEIRTTDVAPGGRRLDVSVDRVLFQEEGYGIRYYRCDLPYPPYPSLSLAWGMWQEKGHWDVAHVHGLFNVPVTTAQLALRTRLRVPYVVRTCGMLDTYGLRERRHVKHVYYRTLERPNLAAAARIHVSTPFEQRAVQALNIGPPVVVIPQGVSSPPPSTGNAPARPFVLFLSRVARKKGLELLVKAFAAVATERPDLDLVIAGPDERGHRRDIERLVAELDLTERVSFPGLVRGGQKGDLLAHAAAFALTSHDENFGVAVAEAVHAGLPVLVSDRLGLAADVKRYGAGEVVPLDVMAISSALRTILDRGKQAYAKGTRAMAHSFDWSVAAERIERLYREIRAAPRPAPNLR